MRNFALTLLFATALTTAKAQENKVYQINPGDKIMWVIPFNDIFEYPAFKQGAVYFRSKSPGGGMLNYSHLSQEMFFIDNNGDTMALADTKEIDSVVIGNDVFFSADEGFIKIDTAAGDIKLGESNFFYVTNRQVKGLYGQPTDASGNNRYNRFVNGTAASNMVAQDIVTLAKTHTLYVGKKFNKLQQLNKKSLSNVYGKQQIAFDQYLLQNQVNFSKKSDVLKLMAWMSSQQ